MTTVSDIAYVLFSSHHSQGYTQKKFFYFLFIITRYNNCTSFNNQLNWFDCQIDLELCISVRIEKKCTRHLLTIAAAVLPISNRIILTLNYWYFMKKQWCCLKITKDLCDSSKPFRGIFVTFAQWYNGHNASEIYEDEWKKKKRNTKYSQKDIQEDIGLKQKFDRLQEMARIFNEIIIQNERSCSFLP